jgi:hypothetical protein
MNRATSQTARRPITLTVAAIAIFWLTIAGWKSAFAKTPGFSRTVDNLIDRTVANNRLPSICVAIGKRGKVIYTHCAGQMDVAKTCRLRPRQFIKSDRSPSNSPLPR